jgi:cytochrome c-type biogenesis protein
MTAPSFTQRARAAALLLSACAAAACGPRDIGEYGKTTAVATEVAVGKPVPMYGAPALAGGVDSLTKHRGEVVLLNVWATWCIPCQKELPDLEKLHQRYQGEGLTIIGASIDAAADAGQVKGFASDHGVTYPLWLDADDKVTGIFYAVGVPATYLIGRDGVLRWRALGPIRPDDPKFHDALKTALAEPATH